MKFVGIDLAWGSTAWTGLAVVDEGGRLTAMQRVRTDEDIAAALQAELDGPVLVSIDAPLIVTNASGRRPCESLVSTLFGRFHAGAHSSNLSLPSFRDGPRGGRVAKRLGLDVNPGFPAREPVRRAIEVYPHPATVTLFGLQKVLPYKAKPGRSPQDRQRAMQELMQFMTSLGSAMPALQVDACDDWMQAVRDVARATTHAEIARWEDAVDAVLCAYIGLHRWWHGDEQSVVLGDVETGYIVVPLDERLEKVVRQGPRLRLSNAEVEGLAVDIVLRTARREGSMVEDTRFVASAVGDLTIDGRAVEVKASAGSVRGADVWLEPRQAEALMAGTLALVLVEHVRADGSGVVRWFDQTSMRALLPRLREHRYFMLPVPVAVYDVLEQTEVVPHGL